MFKLLILNSDTPQQLDDLQDDWDVIEVRDFGNDDTNRYILVQLATKVPDSNTPPAPPASGSIPQAAK